MKIIKTLLALCGLVFLGILAIAFLASPSKSSPQAQSPTNSSGPESSPAAPPFSMQYQGVEYSGSMVSDVGVVVLGAKTSPVLMTSFDAERADGTFVIVAVGISNRQHDAITMSDSLFNLIDEQGNVYSASSKTLALKNSLFLDQINPGVSKVGTIMFDVPPSIVGENLRLRFRGGMTGDTAELPIVILNAQKPAPAAQEPEPQGSQPPEQAPEAPQAGSDQ